MVSRTFSRKYPDSSLNCELAVALESAILQSSSSKNADLSTSLAFRIQTNITIPSVSKSTSQYLQYPNQHHNTFSIQTNITIPSVSKPTSQYLQYPNQHHKTFSIQTNITIPSVYKPTSQYLQYPNQYCNNISTVHLLCPSVVESHSLYQLLRQANEVIVQITSRYFSAGKMAG